MYSISLWNWKVTWFEVWVDANLRIPYILMLCLCTDQKYWIINPQEGNKVEADFNSCLKGLMAARTWLSEDEFEPLAARTAED